MNAQVSPGSVQRLLASGIEPERLARLLVATGVWSESGASDIVSTMAGVNRPASAVTLGTPVGLSTIRQRDTALRRD